MLIHVSRHMDDVPLLRENLRRTHMRYTETQRQYLRALGKKRRGEHNGVVRGIRGELKKLQTTLDTIRTTV